MNWKGFRRKYSWPNQGTALEFASVRIVGVLARIQTKILSNTNLGHYP
jgi:hypothetical protein